MTNQTLRIPVHQRPPPKFSEKIFNFYNGKGYEAASPLLGATGDGGEFITPLANKLIENNAYKSVVIVSSGIAGTPISRLKKGGDLNKMLIETISQLFKTYRPTHIVWHQGESDFIIKTSVLVYAQSFQSIRLDSDSLHK